MKIFDTIAAVSTPRGKGGVAMIRISGADALAVGDAIFRRKSGEALSLAPSAKMVRGEIVTPDGTQSIDDGMAAVFRAPSSFTGEDTVEIYCHGGMLVTERVLTAALSAGARAAEAGEFTRRAFITGKLGLSEAEALGALLEAKNFGQLRLARNGLKGRLAERIRSVYDSLTSVLAGIYAAIDFPDEDLNEYSREQIRQAVADAKVTLEVLGKTYRTGRAVSEGIPTVICGRANAGKSSVYNAIVGYEAAIVTDVEGTTRDVLRQTASLGNTTLLLSDTAGIRRTSDKVESIGIERALREIESAELILAVFDGSVALDGDDIALIEKLNGTGKVCIALINKTDLGTLEDTEKRIRGSFERCVTVCADTADGFDKLAEVVDSAFIDCEIDMDNDAVVTGARQYSAVELAISSLDASLCDLDAQAPLDLCCIGIETAMSALGEIDGRELGEEIVSEIFSKFCVGK